MTTVVYVSMSHPSFSETFVSAEMEEMVRRGFTIYSYSLRVPPTNLTPSVPYIAKPKPPIAMIGWAALAGLRMVLSERYRLNLSDRSHRSLTRAIFAVAHGLRLRWHLRGIPEADRLLHAHFLARPAEVARIATLDRGVAMVTVHATDAQVPETPFARRFLDHFATFRCASRDVQRELLSHAPGLSTAVIPCVVELPTDRIDDSSADRLNVLTVARLVETKGFSEMVPAMERFAALVGPCTWTIVGDGPLMSSLSSWARREPSNLTIRLLGAIPHSETLGEMQRAGAFLLLCKMIRDPQTGLLDGDGLPVALMEAMWVGLPVVTTNVAGIPELVDRTTGYVVNAQDSQEVADALTLATAKARPVAILREARRRVELEFETRVVGDKLVALTESVDQSWRSHDGTR